MDDELIHLNRDILQDTHRLLDGAIGELNDEISRLQVRQLQPPIKGERHRAHAISQVTKSSFNL